MTIAPTDNDRIIAENILAEAEYGIRHAREHLETIPEPIRHDPWVAEAWKRTLNHLSAAWFGTQELLAAIRDEIAPPWDEDDELESTVNTGSGG